MASDPTEIEILHLTQIVGTFESGSVKLACNIACFRCTALAQSTFLVARLGTPSVSGLSQFSTSAPCTSHTSLLRVDRDSSIGTVPNDA